MVNLDARSYYVAFLDFLSAVGAYQHAVKMGVNVDEGVYPVQKVAYEYHLQGAALDSLIAARGSDCYQALSTLDYWSQRVGYPRMSSEDKGKMLKFAKDTDRRRYLRDNIRRARAKGELYSAKDLIIKRYELEKKRRAKACEEAGE